MSPLANAPFEAWLYALERRHLADLTFAEVRRALQALSSIYVEGRWRSSPGKVLDGAGKRAAFALFYAPLHFLTVREIVRRLGAAAPPPRRVHDLGCGTGAAGAAWADACAPRRPALLGFDRHPWAVAEARWTWRQLRFEGNVRRADLQDLRLAGRPEAIVAAYALNELAPDVRDAWCRRLLRAASRGARVLIVEPIAKPVTPWWPGWAAAFREAGGRDDLWRFPVELPRRLRLLDRAAGLDHRELTARSLFV